MKIEDFAFGSIRIDGVTYKDDVLIDCGHIRKRDKEASRKYREAYGHTPLSADEPIPWNCQRLIIGTGVEGKLPILPEVKIAAEKKNIVLLLLPTQQAIEELRQSSDSKTNAILHITC